MEICILPETANRRFSTTVRIQLSTGTLVRTKCARYWTSLRVVELPVLDIVLFYKKDDPLDPSYYRGIALMNRVPKIFTSLIVKRLFAWCERHKIVPEPQGGHARIVFLYSKVESRWNSTGLKVNWVLPLLIFVGHLTLSCIPRCGDPYTTRE